MEYQDFYIHYIWHHPGTGMYTPAFKIIRMGDGCLTSYTEIIQQISSEYPSPVEITIVPPIVRNEFEV